MVSEYSLNHVIPKELSDGKGWNSLHYTILKLSARGWWYSPFLSRCVCVFLTCLLCLFVVCLIDQIIVLQKLEIFVNTTDISDAEFSTLCKLFEWKHANGPRLHRLRVCLFEHLLIRKRVSSVCPKKGLWVCLLQSLSVGYHGWNEKNSPDRSMLQWPCISGCCCCFLVVYVFVFVFLQLRST